MMRHQAGNTVLGILVGMLSGILLTSALAWFIFKSPAPYVPKEQVVARNLKLPAGVIDELMAIQRRTGNPNATITSGGFRVRTNSQHEIFVTPITASGVASQPETQVRHTGSAGGNGKPRFEFYEMLSKRHYPGEQELQPVVQNQGRANIAIYDAPPPRATLPRAASGVTASSSVARPGSAVATTRPASAVVNSRPFVSQREAAASAVVIKPTARPGEALARPDANVRPEKMTSLQVDFFPSFGDASKLQEKLLSKDLPVRLQEEKVLGKRAGYTVLVGPFVDTKALADARSKLKKMGFSPIEH